MKLRKILAGFLAGAVAVTSMVVTSVTASAAAGDSYGTYEVTYDISDISAVATLTGLHQFQLDIMSEESVEDDYLCWDYDFSDVTVEIDGKAIDCSSKTGYGIANYAKLLENWGAEETISEFTTGSELKVTFNLKDTNGKGEPNLYVRTLICGSNWGVYSSASPLTKSASDAPATTYTVTIDDKITNGTVTLNPTEFEADETVALSVTPADGYELDTITVTTESGKSVTVTDGVFTMPAENVKVTATFKATATEDEPTVDTPTESDTVIWEGKTDMGTEWGASVSAAAFEAAEGDTLKITYTVGSAATYQQLKIMDGDWTPLTAPTTNEWDCVELGAATTTYEVALNAADAAALTSKGIVVSGYNVTVTKIELILAEEEVATGFDQTKADVEAAAESGDVLMQTATFGDVEAVRYTKVVSSKEIENAKSVTFTFESMDANGNVIGTGTYTSNKYYTSLMASGAKVDAPENYVFLSLTVKDIPDGVTLKCTGITLS